MKYIDCYLFMNKIDMKNLLVFYSNKWKIFNDPNMKKLEKYIHVFNKK